MSTLVFEIVELPTGEFVLQRPDSKEEPLVAIRFSKEAAGFLKSNCAEIAKTMLEAGIEHAEGLVDALANVIEDDDSPRTLH